MGVVIPFWLCQKRQIGMPFNDLVDSLYRISVLDILNAERRHRMVRYLIYARKLFQIWWD